MSTNEISEDRISGGANKSPSDNQSAIKKLCEKISNIWDGIKKKCDWNTVANVVGGILIFGSVFCVIFGCSVATPLIVAGLVLLLLGILLLLLGQVPLGKSKKQD